MPTYMLDSGRLEPVAHQDVVPDGFCEQWCALVRPQVLELTETAAFAVAWDDARPPLLTAVTPHGQVLTAAVVPRLDLVTLAELIARSGRALVSSWAQVAERYPRGAAAFRRDWNAFRENLSRPAGPLPTLTVVTGAVSEEVSWSMSLLDQVRIIRARVRRDQQGRHLLDLDPAASARGVSAHHWQVPVDQSSGPAEPAPVPAQGDPLASRPASDIQDRRPPTRPASRRAAAPVEAPTPTTVPSPDDPGDREALELVAKLVQAPASIELRHDHIRQPATLQAGGVVVLPDGARYTDLRRACATLIGADHPDPWLAWRFVDGNFALAEARAEAIRYRDRERARPNGTTANGRLRS
ncbi:MAG TPA: hypothetical protein VK063_06755 [Beutenbergiaceae bacterium]|nr:hypothetical protein [Beutenbergiaceae bacterium]